LIKTAHQHLLLLVGFDTLIYRKYYDTPPILVGHHRTTQREPEAGSRATGAKRRIQPALAEPAEKRKKAEPAAKSLLPPRIKKVIKRRATVVAG
jgi:hypothetical protein